MVFETESSSLVGLDQLKVTKTPTIAYLQLDCNLRYHRQIFIYNRAP
jgi:hypothetical protein